MISIDDEIVKFMDFLDLDEARVDEKLQIFMQKNNYYDLSSKNYVHILKLLKYKYLINIQEGTECDNHNEFEFMAKLLLNLNTQNIDYVCEIINIVLSLNNNKLCGYAEHLLQQLLPGIEYSESENVNNLLLLKASESILNAVIRNQKIVSLFLFESPLENIIYINNTSLQHYFLTNIIPAFVRGVSGYKILDRLWATFSKHNDKKSINLQVLSVLSEYFLPMPNSNGVIKFESDVINQFVFWDLILYGLHSKISSLRRMSIYLTKRAVDSCMTNVCNIDVRSEDGTEIFNWKKSEQEALKLRWDNYFVLLETLDESQSNIVLPCFQLFDVVKDISWKWLNCAFTKGLTHQNFNVRQKCLEVRLKYFIRDKSEANLILSVLNDINLYENEQDFKGIIETVFKKQENLKYIIQELPTVKWSAVSLYHITNIIANTKVNTLEVVGEESLTDVLCSIMQWPCNDIMIRTGVYINLLLFLRSMCEYMNWKNVLKLITSCPSDISCNKKLYSIISDCIQLIKFTNDEEILQFMSFLTSSHNYHDITLIYLINKKNEVKNFVQILNKKLATIEDITSRQYAQKMLCFEDFVYVATLAEKCYQLEEQPDNVLSTIIGRSDTIFNYIQALLSNEFDSTSTEQLEQFVRSCRFPDVYIKEEKLFHLHKSSVIVLRSPNANFSQKFISIVILNKIICKSGIYKIDINILEESLGYVTSPDVIHNLFYLFGRIISKFFETTCEILYRIVSIECDSPSVKSNIKSIINIINCTRECGGYGCLKWNLKTMRILLPDLLTNSDIFNFKQCLERSWKDVQELNKQNEYLQCLEGFIEFIINQVVLKQQEHADLLLENSLKILEYGHVSNTTIVCLAKAINRMKFEKDCHLQHILLSELLLFCPVLRKDQRITEKTTKLILDDSEECDYDLKYDIQNIGVSTLLTIHDHNIFSAILLIIMNRVDRKLANIQRYHENTECHYMILTALQNVLCISWLQSKHIDIKKVASWSIQLLAKLPHHASVKFYLEWIIALSFCFEDKKLNDPSLQEINFESIPIVSQLMVLYYYLSKNDAPLKKDYEYVINYLLSFTMGQNFNVRITAQYLSSKLHKKYNDTLKIEKYDYTMKLIEKTLEQGSHEKAYVKLKNDCIVNIFNIIQCLNTEFIYYYVPACFKLALNDVKTLKYIPKMNICEEYILEHDGDKNLKDMWLNKKNFDKQLMEVANVNKTVLISKEQDVAPTIQKKYIPWRNMADVEVLGIEKKKENQSQLIIVASLIDKLPNLGGMARTSEVFGVNTLVVDSLRHLQDTQFQGLSVSAERWVNIEEVRPGDSLKMYLGKMKSEGYTIVAAEQTSSSITLQTFNFPLKTLLVLGHEKEGIPFELLPYMDHCVEIPQKGYVRSLNVHVTAAIFVWEYVRQNTL